MSSFTLPFSSTQAAHSNLIVYAPVILLAYAHMVIFQDPETTVGGGEGEGEEQDQVLLPGRTRRTVSPALHGCTLEVKKGELVAVVGAVGSGKSR